MQTVICQLTEVVSLVSRRTRSTAPGWGSGCSGYCAAHAQAQKVLSL